MDILTGCAGSTATEIGKCTAKPIIRHIGYLYNFNKIVEDLTTAKKVLQLEQQKVQESIKQAEMNTEVVDKVVQGWLANVQQLMKEVQTLENKVQVNMRFCNGWCPDWIWRYKLCKKVIQKTTALKELQEKGNFSQVAHRAPTPGIEIFSSRDFEVFESTKLAFQQIMEALCDDSIKRIGLHGMGGVGKTTLVKEVYKKAKELDIFNDLVMIVVSLTPDVRRIQGEIAGCLNLKLDEESDTARANRICLRIKSVEKILIIVDDIWKDFNLEAIGIPSCDDHEGCKFLLTTRSEHLCNIMRCQRKIPLNLLLEEESLALMKKAADIVDDYPILNDVVLKVVENAKTLIGKSLNDWNVAMLQLRKSRLVDIEGVDEEKNAYACLKWSYDQLKRKTKLCFLLCSLFPEDYNIPIEELTRYAIGLKEYEDVDSLEDIRSQVRATIGSLKDSSMLLEGIQKGYVKMHDMVRDVGLWIASKGENEFKLRACTHLEKNIDFERVTAISLMASNTKQLPDKLVCPTLSILFLGRNEDSKEISDTLFEGMNCLQVLRLEEKILSSQSFQFLTNLRSLYLEKCDFSDNLSSMGKLKRLETLSFQGCGMVALPNELGEMESLKMLDLTNCNKLKWIPPNVIQRLSRLEELIIGSWSFENWDVEGTSTEIINVNISELNSLPVLVMLSVRLDLKHLPQGFVFPDLQRYNISINCLSLLELQLNDNPTCLNSRTLEIKGLEASSMDAFKMLFRTVEYIYIESCEMESIVDTTGGNHTITFTNLVQLYLQKMSCLRTICEGPNQYVIFSNLTVLDAYGCKRLINLFSSCIAQSLKKLKKLHLEHCNELRQIIYEDGKILESHNQPICFPELETIRVHKCRKLEYIFPTSVARDLPQLESLELVDLPQLKQVFGHEKEGDVGDENNNVLSKLRNLKLMNLLELGRLYRGNSSSVWPSLEDLYVVNCPKMKASFFTNVEANVRALEKVILYTSQCFVLHVCVHYKFILKNLIKN
ncbi:probable disease resistance protein At4g27220 [Fagus crenata]